MKISIIIPVFNEEATVSQVIDKVFNLKLPGGLKTEIIVVNDGSTDQTDKKLAGNKNNFKYFSHQKNLGKGAAIKSGLEKASGDLVLIQDADLEYDPIYIEQLLEPFKKDYAKVVYGTRLINYPLKLWGKNKTILPTHLLANKFLTTLTNILYGSNLTDMETGYKIFSRKVLSSLSIKSDKFDFEAEVTSKVLKRGIKIIEVPIVTKPRTYKEGKKIGWEDGLIAIWTLIKYRFFD